MTRIERGAVKLFTRNGHNWTARMPQLAQACKALQVANAWLDGEAVVLDSGGCPDFNGAGRPRIRRGAASGFYM
jgi:bifunctional non-homologous end joining protein LigD